MAETYKILGVGDPREWSSEKYGGRFFAYPLTLEGVEGSVEWSRKADSNPPQVGDSIICDIESGPHGKKAKINWDAMREEGGRSGGSYGGPGGSEYMKPYPPDAVARMGRSHAQEMALRYAEQVGALQSMNPDKLRSDPRSSVPKHFWRLVDAFESDVEAAAAQKAAQGAGVAPPVETAHPVGSASPAPARSPEDDGSDIPF